LATKPEVLRRTWSEPVVRSTTGGLSDRLKGAERSRRPRRCGGSSLTEQIAGMEESPTGLPGPEGGRPGRRAPAGRSELPGSGRAADGVAFLVVVAAVVAALWYIDRFAVDVVLSDQWADIGLIHQAHSGTLTLNSLWAQHNENRIFFPDLVVLALAYTTHFNVVVEDYLNGVLLVLSTVLVVVAHKRRSPLLHWIRYCPVVLALLSFDLLASALFGFQLSWFLVLFGLAAAIFLLDRRDLTWPFLIGSVVVAVVGSFSSLQGLFIWPAGLVLLYLRRRPKPFVLAWIACAVATGAVYFFHFDTSASGDRGSYAFTHPLLAARVFFTAIGDGVGVRLQPPHHGYSGNDPILVVGALITVVAVWAIIYGFRSGRSTGSPIGVALVVFGLLFAVSITVGRLQLGPSNASRYLPFEVTVWVGCYLALFDRPIAWTREAWSARLAQVDFLLGVRKRPDTASSGGDRTSTNSMRRVFDLAARVVLVGLIVVQLASGLEFGLIDAHDWHKREVAAANVMVNIHRESDAVVQRKLGTYPAPFLREMTQFMKAQRLGLFAGQATIDGSSGTKGTSDTKVVP
jgi:hypothetical protein